MDIHFFTFVQHRNSSWQVLCFCSFRTKKIELPETLQSKDTADLRIIAIYDITFLLGQVRSTFSSMISKILQYLEGLRRELSFLYPVLQDILSATTRKRGLQISRFPLCRNPKIAPNFFPGHFWRLPLGALKPLQTVWRSVVSCLGAVERHDTADLQTLCSGSSQSRGR